MCVCVCVAVVVAAVVVVGCWLLVVVVNKPSPFIGGPPLHPFHLSRMLFCVCAYAFDFYKTVSRLFLVTITVTTTMVIIVACFHNKQQL